MKPKFLFTLGGDLGTQAISEPEGWKSIIFNLERDLTYWSLIENFELPLIFYGTAEGKNGGYQYLSNAKNNGIDTLVTIDIQISFDEGLTYETCFDGRIDLSTAKEIVYRAKIQAAIVRNDLWAVFMAKKSTPIDLFSTTDIYGHSRFGINSQGLSLPSQKLRQQYEGHGDSGVSTSYTIPDFEYGQIDFADEVLSEIEDKFSLPLSENPARPAEIFSLKYAGSYSFDIRIYTATAVILGASTDSALQVRLQINDNVATVLTQTNESSGLDSWTKHTYTGTQTLSVNDSIRLYFYNNNAPGASYTFVLPANLFHDTKLVINADTVYVDTQTQTVLLHDAALSICDRILGKNDSFYSEFLGGAKTSIFYPNNGCGYLNTLTRGKNIRGYSFSEKPFTLSFDDWWSGANPIFNLGLGYDVLNTNSPGASIIRVEQKSSFFNTSPSVYLTAINDIQIEFDLNLFTKTIEIGFEQWAAESASGIDDPQTKHTYGVRFQLFGKDEKQLSKFIAASLAIEQGRRLTKVQNQDWRLDENTFIIAISSQNSVGNSPAAVTEQPEKFASGITNLNNSDTRYNPRHTPARMLQRWLNFYNGQMQSYLTDSFKFQSGEGNILMSWSGDGGCDSGSLTENQNQSVSSNYLFLPIVYLFTHPLTWDEYSTIRNNRKNAISISWIDPQGNTQTKIAFIRKLGYDINKSRGTFQVWIRS